MRPGPDVANAAVYSVLAEGRNMKKELTVDGLLPNAEGYALMAPVFEKAIAAALRGPGGQ